MHYRLYLTPQTHIRATQNDRWLFKIPENKLPTVKHLQRKRRLEKYNQYKSDLQDAAIEAGFEIPEDGFSVTFMLPVPLGRSWNKLKKRTMDHRPHQNKPDLDNLLKAFMDGLMKEDKKLWRLHTIQKLWTNTEHGWIDIEVPDADIHLKK